MTIEEMRTLSGSVASEDKLVLLMYILLRDHFPSGKLEKIVDGIENSEAKVFSFTNGWMAQYAINLSNRIKSPRSV